MGISRLSSNLVAFAQLMTELQPLNLENFEYFVTNWFPFNFSAMDADIEMKFGIQIYLENI